MGDPEKKICRYFNTLGGCWYGDGCKFLHIPDKRPPCKFFGSSTGCRYGENCHFSHDRTPFKSVENYNNSSSELIKEVFKENLNPSELSGTNNNNMTQSLLIATTTSQDQADDPKHSTALMVVPTTTSTKDQLKLTTQITSDPDGNGGFKGDLDGVGSVGAQKFTSFNRTVEETCASTTEAEAIEANASIAAPEAVPGTLGDATELPTTNPSGDVHSSDGANAAQTSQAVALYSNGLSQELHASSGTELTSYVDYQNYAVTTVNEQSNMVINEMEIFCGSCKRVLQRRSNESYCTLLKDHYLECFLDKEGDHVKYVKSKAALEPGQMYWCKSCILIFEKPWSLFQHMADKAKGSKVQRWEKKIHLDWMDSVSGLMAGYDLGLFSPAKLRIDLRNLLADQHTMEEEVEAAAVTVAAMMQWLAPLSCPWRLQQREVMRKIEQMNRQMLRKASLGLSGQGHASVTGHSIRPALPSCPTTASLSQAQLAGANNSVCGNGYASLAASSSTIYAGRGSPASAPPGKASVDSRSIENQSPTISVEPSQMLDNDLADTEDMQNEMKKMTVTGRYVGQKEPGVTQMDAEMTRTLGEADGAGLVGQPADSLPADKSESSNERNVLEIPCAAGDNVESQAGKEFQEASDTKQQQSITCTAPVPTSARGDDGGRRFEGRRGVISSYVTNPGKTTFSNGKSFSDQPRYVRGYPRSTNSFGNPNSVNNYHRGNFHRANRMGGVSVGMPSSRAANSFNPPSFHASMDFNCGFTDEEVGELLSQNINPWDSEAPAALAAIRGELDHLLD